MSSTENLLNICKVCLLLVLFMSDGHACQHLYALPQQAEEDTIAAKTYDVISRHIEAMGGKSNWEQVHGIKKTGQYTSFSLTGPFTTIITDGGLLYTHYPHGKHEVTEGFDGKVHWTIDPWQGFDFPRKLNKSEKNVLSQKADFFTPFLHYQERGYQASYQGDVVIDGLPLIQIELIRSNGFSETWYLHANNLLPYKYISQWVDFTYPAAAETFFDDFREVNGLLIPFYRETTYGTRHITTEIEEIAINPHFSDSLFVMPGCTGMDMIRSICGSWNMKAEVMTRAGQWQVSDSSKVYIGLLPDGRIHGRLEYDMAFPVNTTFTINYNRRSEQYQMVIFSEMFATTDIFSGILSDDMLILNETSSGSQSENATRTRYLFDLTDNEIFSITRSRSNDGGNSWQQAERLFFMAN